MKIALKMLAVLLITALCAGILMIPAYAADVTRDGLEVTLTTNQTTYSPDETICAVLTVKNTGTAEVTNVTLESLVPSGYEAADTSRSIATLAAGESVSLTVNLIPGGPSPETGDRFSMLPAVFLVLAVAALSALLIFGKRMRRKVLSVLLCVAMIGTIAAGIPAQAADTDDLSTIEITTTVTVDSAELDINAVVSYLAYEDQDADGIDDRMEILLGTDPNQADSDGDSLSDYIEVYQCSTDPLMTDSDSDGITDGDEDADNDSLTNLEELELGTSPARADTDADLLPDGDEKNTYGTDPLTADTDGDGVADGQERTLGTDPLTVQTSFNITESNGTASVDITLSGNQVGTLDIKPVENAALFPQEIPGYMGKAYDFTVNGDFDTADISFEFDESALNHGSEPVIYYFNETKQTLEPLTTILNGNVATATVEHFSTYILLDRTVYDGSFTWNDVWDSTGTYSSVEVVLVIDDSGSMGRYGDNLDPDNERLTVAQELIDNLPDGCKIGVVRFASSTNVLTTELTADKETAKAYLTTDCFTSMGSYTYLYTAIHDAMGLFQSTEPDALKTAIVITDGLAHDYDALHTSTITAAQDANVRLYTVGLGDETMCQDDYLQPLAEQTGGSFYFAQDASQLAAIYEEISKMIDLSADMDSDGIPDYYEDNLVAFSGIDLQLDKTKADTDGDGLLDSEEVKIELIYSEDRTQVYIKGTMLSSPTLVDTDYDGIADDSDATPYDNSFTGTLTTNAAASSVSGKMDYSWFFGDNTVYNADLSKLSILFSAAIYSENKLALADKSGTSTAGSSITQVMDYFGLENATSVSLSKTYSDIHLSEVGLGYRNVVVGGELKTVLAVTVRGTNGTLAEWSSNCDIGDLSTDTEDDDWANPLNHKGFDIAATRIMRVMESYIAEQKLDTDNLVYWVTGHSRGAAIANIIGANLEDAGKTAFTYTFAAPNCTLAEDAASYLSIFNIISKDDFVPCMPMAAWGYTTYGRSTSSIGILSGYESEWESLTGISSYNADANNMDACVDALGGIVTAGADPRVDSYRYTCDCHGDGSNDTITITNYGMSADSREGAIAKIPSNALPYCTITRYEGTLFWGWDFDVCQTPAYLMQLLAAFMGGEIDIYRFVVELNIADRYENAKTAIEAAGLSGIEHPHYTESYYVLACHVTAESFG